MIYHQFDPSCWNFSLDCFILQVGLGSDHYDVWNVKDLGTCTYHIIEWLRLKSVPHDHSLSSLSKFCDAVDPQDSLFYPTFTLMIDSNMYFIMKI